MANNRMSALRLGEIYVLNFLTSSLVIVAKRCLSLWGQKAKQLEVITAVNL